MYTIVDLIGKLAEIDEEQYKLYLRISKDIKAQSKKITSQRCAVSVRQGSMLAS